MNENASIPAHKYIGKRAIHLNDMVMGFVVKVKEDKDHERWDIVVLDKEIGGHRHYFAIEGDDERFFGFDLFTQFLNEHKSRIKDDENHRTAGNTAG